MSSDRAPGGRTARLVLVSPDGAPIGSLPPVRVLTPWWQDVEPVVTAVAQQYGVQVTILRLLEADREQPHGGQVTYLAEVEKPVAAEPWHGTLEEHPQRQSFARPGGPAADLAWAQSVMVEHQLQPKGPAVQVRTWNLSSLWRMPVEGQTLWLKVVPPFFAHEGRLLARLCGERVPRLLAHSGGRMLLEEIPGDDLVHAELPTHKQMVTLLVDLQLRWSTRVDELLSLGLPDVRGSALIGSIREVVERTADHLPVEDRATLSDFAAALPDRLGEVASCGLEDTLVHGDFWPGNFRGRSSDLTLLDWGDSCIGHPLLDHAAFLDRIPSHMVKEVEEHWIRSWKEAVPESDPARTMRLLAPVAVARQAVVFRHFLDNIEPSEYPYHQADPAERLHRTATLLSQGTSSTESQL